MGLLDMLLGRNPYLDANGNPVPQRSQSPAPQPPQQAPVRGLLSGQDAYNTYAQTEIEAGRKPLPRDIWAKQQQAPK